MILKSPYSRLSIVNLFADFILKQIPHEEDTIIQVIDCINFYVIKGKTTHKEPLNIGNLRDKFIQEFQDFLGEIKLTHTIDLIEYDSSLPRKSNFVFSYHKSKNCSYVLEQIESFVKDNSVSYDYTHFIQPIDDGERLFFYSEFPHGYSLSQGRLTYNYGKHIFYNIPSSYPVNTLIFELNTNNEQRLENPIIVKNTLDEVDEVLTSSIKDVFDFDMSWLEKEMKKVDWFSEITNPLQEYDFVKNKVKDFIIF